MRNTLIVSAAAFYFVASVLAVAAELPVLPDVSAPAGCDATKNWRCMSLVDAIQVLNGIDALDKGYDQPNKDGNGTSHVAFKLSFDARMKMAKDARLLGEAATDVRRARTGKLLETPNADKKGSKEQIQFDHDTDNILAQKRVFEGLEQISIDDLKDNPIPLGVLRGLSPIIAGTK